MKKTFAVITVLAAMLFMANTAKAQITNLEPATTGAIEIRNKSTNVLELWCYRLEGTNYSSEVKYFNPGTITLLHKPNFNWVEASDPYGANTMGQATIEDGKLTTFTMFHRPQYDTNETPHQLISVNDFNVVTTTDLNAGQ